MKDLEKIKSEDLACQVQDANPGNFAIEQEVAQLVGATVPAPTQPSADEARELGAQLLVFLRRALLPIRSALRTAVAAIYAHLDSRCTDYTPAAYASYQDPSTVPPYDPMRPLTPRTLPNLLTALTAFSARKISNGSAPSDGIPDGISLARLLCADYADVVELKDDTHGWIYSRNSLAQFPNAKKVTLGCKDATINIVSNNSVIEELNIEELETLPSGYNGMNYFNALTALKHFYAPKLKTFTSGQSTNLSGLTACEWISMPEWTGYVNVHVAIYLSNNPVLKWIYIPKCGSLNGFHKNHTGGFCCSNDILEKVTMGTITAFTYSYGTAEHCAFYLCPRLIDLEIGAETAVSLYIAGWNPSYVLSDNPTGNDLVTDEGISTNLDQFLSNFREHIALRLTANGSGLTLTLSQAVRDAIHAAESTYGIENIIVTQKGWTLSPAPGASSQ